MTKNLPEMALLKDQTTHMNWKKNPMEGVTFQKITICLFTTDVMI